ncbi:MAG: hypothetical protein R6U63_08040 [Longimicrobiales bacterium]
MSWTAPLFGAAVLALAPADAPGPTCAEPSTPPADTVPAVETSSQEALEARLTLGGALRFNLQYRDWARGRFELRRAADFDFDTFRLNADGSYGDLLFSAEYRIYAGYHMLHHGWVGYGFSDALDVLLGVHKVPFGPLPYASHNWFFQLPYYVGLEDDYDAGVNVLYAAGRWGVQMAFYLNDEGSFTGGSVASARYSYDVVPATPGELGYAGLETARSNEEVNQVNGRLTYTAPLSSGKGSAELGVSGQWGQLHNRETDRFGSHWAASAHVDATRGRWNVIAEAIRYAVNPDEAGAVEPFVVMGAYDAPYKVARAASLYLLGVAYTLPVAWGPIASIRFYDDFTYMVKADPTYPDTRQNVLGSAISAGPVYVYMDVASGWNHPWLGPDYGRALAEGDGAGGWSTRFNMNVGYYF